MENKDYKLGDIVSIRDWDDMEQEYGLYSPGNINIPAMFTRYMEQYCGKNLKIARIKRNECEGYDIYSLKDKLGNYIRYNFTKGMFR